MSKFMRGSALLESGNTTPGCHLTDEEKRVFNLTLDKCREYGLTFYPPIIQKVRYDEMSEIAAYGGFPHRYPHWYWGMQYEELQRGYEHNQHRIYELVVNCLVFDARVSTTRGYVKISDVKIGDEIYSRDGLRKVLLVNKQPISKVVRLKLHDHQGVECTPHHKWFVLKVDSIKPEWVRACDLREGDLILAGNKYENFLGYSPVIKWDENEVFQKTLTNVRWKLKTIVPVKNLTHELSELLGVCTGDGSCGMPGSGENIIQVSIDKKQTDYHAHVANLFGKCFGAPARLDEKPSCMVVSFCSKYAIDFLDNIGLKKGVTYSNKLVPSIIWQASNEYRASYLRGFFDTDGYVGTYLSASCKNEGLAKDIQLLLLELGIRSRITHVQNKHNDIWTILIKGRVNVVKFEKYVGFSLKYKAEKLNNLVNSGNITQGDYKLPAIQKFIVSSIKSLPAQNRLPAWIKRIVGRNLTNNNTLWQIVNKLIAFGCKGFEDVLDLLETPMHEVQSVEEAGEQETIDIALDHNDHDFLANGLISHNTNPCVMYLMASNTMVDNVTVVAHATGHNDFFKNNIFFSPTDENMMNKLANNGTRIRKYVSRWGKEKVTEFIDHVLRIQTLIDPAKAWTEREIREPVIKDKRDYDFPRRLKVDSDRSHMESWINPKSFIDGEYKRIEKQELAKELELFQISDKDVFGFLKDYARLKPWQQDIISMLYEESMYFSPQRATKTLNEGWACGLRDTLVLTEHGYIKLGEIVDKKLKIKVNDGIQLQNVTNWFEFEDRDCLKISTKRGYIFEGTTTHRLVDSNFEWKRLDEFKIGDQILLNKANDQWSGQYVRIIHKSKDFTKSLSSISKEHDISRDRLYVIIRNRTFNDLDESLRNDLKVYVEEKDSLEIDGNYSQRTPINVPDCMNEDLAAFLGYMTGDGYIDGDGRALGLTTGDDAQAERYIQLVEKLFELKCNKKWDDSSLNGRWRVCVNSRNLVEFVLKLGYIKGYSARTKTIPEMVLRSPKSVMSSYLSAYFDCDGGAYRKNGVILSTSSPVLANQVQTVLLNYGIISSKYDKLDDNFHIIITSHSAVKFYYEIGFVLERKQSALKDYISRKQNVCEQGGVDEIVSIESLGKQAVYDITVENTHRYSAQGFINHNSHVDYELMTRQGLVSLGQKTQDMGIVEYAVHKMGVLGGKYSTNPYKTGFYLLLDIEERWNRGQFGTAWEECKDMRQKENWDLKTNLGKQKIFEVRKYHNDVTFINEFVTQEFCNKFEYFEYKHYPNGEWKIESRDAKIIKRKLLQKHVNGGLPDIRIVDPNHRNKGYFLLQHYTNEFDDRVIYEPYARSVLTSIHYLWGREVMLVTKDKNHEEQVYVCVGNDPEKDVALMSRQEYEKTWI